MLVDHGIERIAGMGHQPQRDVLELVDGVRAGVLESAGAETSGERAHRGAILPHVAVGAGQMDRVRLLGERGVADGLAEQRGDQDADHGLEQLQRNQGTDQNQDPRHGSQPPRSIPAREWAKGVPELSAGGSSDLRTR